MFNRNNTTGFTLIELIIVVVIIAVLATLGLNSYSRITKQANETRVKSDLNSIKKAVILARSISKKTLGEITGDWCTACTVCSGNLKNVPDTHACVQDYQRFISRIQPYEDISHIKRDPWGSPYTLDENDGEFASNRCRPDTIRSVGPDGIYANSDDIVVSLIPIYPGC